MWRCVALPPSQAPADLPRSSGDWSLSGGESRRYLSQWPRMMRSTEMTLAAAGGVVGLRLPVAGASSARLERSRRRSNVTPVGRLQAAAATLDGSRQSGQAAHQMTAAEWRRSTGRVTATAAASLPSSALPSSFPARPLAAVHSSAAATSSMQPPALSGQPVPGAISPLHAAHCEQEERIVAAASPSWPRRLCSPPDMS